MVRKLNLFMIIINFIIFVLLTGCILGLCYRNIPSFSVVDAASMIGTIGSIHGIGLTIWQLLKVKHVTEYVSAEVTKKLESLNDLFSMADISCCEEMIRSIYSYLKQEEYLAASIRLHDIMKILEECIANKFLSTEEFRVRDVMQNLSLDIEALYSPETLNVAMVRKHMAKMSELLMETSSKIKAKNYGH